MCRHETKSQNNYQVHRYESRQIFGGAKDFARIFPNLLEKVLCDFCLHIFSTKTMKIFFNMTSKKDLPVFFCKR